MDQQAPASQKRRSLAPTIALAVVSLGSLLTLPDSYAKDCQSTLRLLGSFETLDRLGFTPDDVVYWPANNHLFISTGGTATSAPGLHEVTVTGRLVRSYPLTDVPDATGILGFSVARVTTGPRRGHFFLSEWNEGSSFRVHEFDSGFNHIGYFSLDDPIGPSDGIAYNPFTRTLILGHGSPELLEVHLSGRIIRRLAAPSPMEGLTFCPTTGTYFGVHHGSPRVQEFTMSGTLVRTFDLSGFGVSNPVGVASGRNLLFVADEGPSGDSLGVIYIFRIPVQAHRQ